MTLFTSPFREQDFTHALILFAKAYEDKVALEREKFEWEKAKYIKEESRVL